MRSRVVFLLARLIPSLLGVLTTAVLTRLLAPADYGLYALGLSVIFFLSIGVFEWLGLSVLRMAPAAKQSPLFFCTVVTCFLATCTLCILGAGLLMTLGELGKYATLTAASLAAAFAAAWFELNQRLQLADLRETDFFRTSAVRGILAVVLVLPVAYIDGRAPVILLALGTSYLLSVVAIREPRLDLLRWQFDWSVFRSLLRYGAPLSVSVGLGTFLMSIDKWMLQGLSGSHSVGLFTAATLVSQVPIMTLAGGIGPSAYSMAVRATEFGSAEMASAQLARNFVALVGIVVPAAVGIIAVSESLAHLLVGPYYWRAVIQLAPYLSAAAVVSSVRAFYVDVAFQLAHRTSPLILTNLIAVVVNVVLDLWLIPQQGELGAARGSLVACLVGLAAGALASRRVFRLPLPWMDTTKILASAAVMFAAVHAMSGLCGPLTLALQISAGATIYFLAVIALDLRGVRKPLAESLAFFRPSTPGAAMAAKYTANAPAEVLRHDPERQKDQKLQRRR